MYKKLILISSITITFTCCTSKNTSNNLETKTYKDTINQVEAVSRFLETRDLYMPGSGNDLNGGRDTRSGKDDYWYKGIVNKGTIDGQFSQWAKDMSDGYEIYKIKNDTLLILE